MAEVDRWLGKFGSEKGRRVILAALVLAGMLALTVGVLFLPD